MVHKLLKGRRETGEWFFVSVQEAYLAISQAMDIADGRALNVTLSLPKFTSVNAHRGVSDSYYIKGEMIPLDLGSPSIAPERRGSTLRAISGARFYTGIIDEDLAEWMRVASAFQREGLVSLKSGNGGDQSRRRGIALSRHYVEVVLTDKGRAELERELIRERTRAGMAAAKARGSKVGREKEATPERIEKARQLILAGASYREAAADVGLAVNTIYRDLPGGVRAVRDAAKIAA